MSWKEIMMTINSDITTPLNKLINNIISKLDNTTYGLSAIKTKIDTINTNIDANVQSYPNVTTGVINKNDNPEVTVYGKGKITLIYNFKYGWISVSVDGAENIYAYFGGNGDTDNTVLNLTFEKSLTIAYCSAYSSITSSANLVVAYLIQTV